MKGDPVPDPDHVARYCGGVHINEDGSVNGAAFRLRPGEQSLSINWLEFLNLLTRDDEAREIRWVLSTKLRLGATAKIAVLNVGQLRGYVASESPDKRNLRILHEPEPDNPSHSGIFNLSPDDDLIADLVADIIQETYPVKS